MAEHSCSMTNSKIKIKRREVGSLSAATPPLEYGELALDKKNSSYELITGTQEGSVESLNPKVLIGGCAIRPTKIQDSYSDFSYVDLYGTPGFSDVVKLEDNNTKLVFGVPGLQQYSYYITYHLNLQSQDAQGDFDYFYCDVYPVVGGVLARKNFVYHSNTLLIGQNVCSSDNGFFIEQPDIENTVQFRIVSRFNSNSQGSVKLLQGNICIVCIPIKVKK